MKEHITNFIKGPSVEDPQLKAQIVNVMLKVDICGAVLFTIISIILKKHYYAIFLCAFCFIFYTIIYLVTKKIKNTKHTNITYMILSLFQGCILFPILYLTAGGIDSGVPIVFISAGVTTILLLDNLAMVITLALNSIFFIAAFMLDWKSTDFVKSFTNLGEFTYSDISLSVILTGIGLGIILRILTAEFDTNQEKATGLLKQIEESSTKDPLTGAYNRRYLMQYIDKCISETQDGKMRTFSLLMFDIDHFKSINDTYGHLAGDDCIKNLTYILKNSLRNVDVVSRYGGEEFICVLPTADDTPAFRRAEQIRSSVEITQLSEDIPKKITVSGGVVVYTPGMTSEELIKAVDENLYIAKENGRNQIVWHNGGIPPLCYAVYDTDVLHPVQNAGRRFTDLSNA